MSCCEPAPAPADELGGGDCNPCNVHPRNDCCVPCLKPNLPKCPVGTYVERVQPIRPERFYDAPTIPFGGVTTYRDDYFPKCSTRTPSFKKASTFEPSAGKFNGLTSYREHFFPKCMTKSPSYKPVGNTNPSDSPFKGVSTYRFDYTGCMADRVKSVKPIHTFNPSGARVDDRTTYRVAYVPFCPREYDYAKQPSMRQQANTEFSCAPMDGLTTYKNDYWNKPICKRNAMKPKNKARFSNARMDGWSTYKNDFNPFHFVRNCEPCIPADSYPPDCGQFMCRGDEPEPIVEVDPCAVGHPCS